MFPPINCWTFTQITEDMSRTVREQWGELHKFMSRVKAKYPTSQCFLKQDKLYVDNRWVGSGLLFWHIRMSHYKSNEKFLNPVDTKHWCTGKTPKINFISVVILEYVVHHYSLLLMILNHIVHKSGQTFLSSSGPGPGPGQVQVRSRSERSEFDLSLTIFLVCTHPPSTRNFFLGF